jgi:hypothetical protein
MRLLVTQGENGEALTLVADKIVAWRWEGPRLFVYLMTDSPAILSGESAEWVDRTLTDMSTQAFYDLAAPLTRPKETP